MANGDLNELGSLLARLNELCEDSLYGEKERVRVHLRRGNGSLNCRIVGVYLDTSSSKEEITIDLFLDNKVNV